MRSPYLKKVIFIYFFYVAQCYAIDKVSFDESTSLFVASEKTVPVVKAEYVGWAANWKWAGADVKPNIEAKNDKSNALSYRGDIPELDTSFKSDTTMGKKQISWVYKWEKTTDHLDAIGFGIDFSLAIDSSAFESPAQAPELLPDKQGWRWQTPDGQSIEVKFSPALANIVFERQQSNKIRALFFTAVKKGSQQTTMTVSVSEKVALASSIKLGYGENDPKSWHRDILPEKTSPLDLSFLNKNDLPAGKHGFVMAQSESLVFEDGVPVRFWGANIGASALFSTSDVDIKAHAKRIAQLGFNLIRIHHHDSEWVQPNIFKNQANNTLEFSPEALKKLDWWIKCLKDQGVYIWLDLHVGRAFTKNDGVENYEELANGKQSAEIKGFNYYNNSIQNLMQKFNETYLNHVNPFTKLAYKADPALIALLITNENELTQHFGNALLPDYGALKHSAIFNKDAKQFSEVSGLPSDKVWRTWEMGESKIYLSDAEHRFNQKMISHLRGLSAKSMIATTSSWGYMGLFGLPSLTDGDLIDAHSYGVAEELNFNPRYNPGFLTWVGAAQVTGKPLSVTEWNMGSFPIIDRYTMPLFTASIANLQGWDAMMFFGYSFHPLEGKMNGDNFSSFNDPAIMGVMPAAALLYRQNHVSSAKDYYQIKLSREDFFFKKQNPTTSKTIRTLLETSRFSVTMPDTKELPWLQANNALSKASIVNNADKDFIPEGQNFVQSDTGELKRDWEKGIHTISTPKSQIASGWIGGEAINLKDVSFNLATKKATVAVQSLENKPIATSKAIFITVMARSVPENVSFLSEPVVGEILISAPAGLKLFPVNSMGKKEKPVSAGYDHGRYHLKLDDTNDAYWFFLSAS